jgi:hypothetical protein
MGVIYKCQLFHPAGPFSTQQIPLHTQQISRSVNVNYLDRQFHQLPQEFASGRREWAQDEEPGRAGGEARGGGVGLAMNSLKVAPVLVRILNRATKDERSKLVYAVNKYAGKTLRYDAAANELAIDLACMDRDKLKAAVRQMCEDYGEKLPIVEELNRALR